MNVSPAQLGLSLRQLKLHAWLCDPQGGLPEHPAIDPRQAWWTAADLVHLTGLYEAAGRRSCLNDLRRLIALRLVKRRGRHWQAGAEA